MERAFILCAGDRIGIAHLPETLLADRGPSDLGGDMRTAHDILDAQAIRAALERNNYNRLAAARELGIHKTTFFRRIKKLGIPLPEQDGRARRKKSP